jgi:predicted secreted Zn-dependent protease
MNLQKHEIKHVHIAIKNHLVELENQLETVRSIDDIPYYVFKAYEIKMTILTEIVKRIEALDNK